MKFIREARMGLPKSFKTGAVVGTYPKPMLVLSFDEGGLEVIPSRNVTTPPGWMQLDIAYEDIVWCTPAEFPSYMNKKPEEWPKVLALRLIPERHVSLDLRPTADSSVMTAVVQVVDLLRSRRTTLPFKTVVADSITGFMDVVLSLITQVSPGALSDARVWAHQIGYKVKQFVGDLCALEAHTVIILHSNVEKNELTGQVTELPSVYSGLRQDLSGYFSQFFYATKKGSKPLIWTQDQMYVKGVGNRWPVGLPAECEPDFKSIYGRELL